MIKMFDKLEEAMNSVERELAAIVFMFCGMFTTLMGIIFSFK